MKEVDEYEYRDYDESGNGKATDAAVVVALLLMFAIVGIAFLLSSCTPTKYVPVESVRTEYKDKIREVHTTDSVVDTRFVFVKGDTVIDYRDRVKWRDRFVHDTCYIETRDSVPVPYPVEKKLTWWQQTKMDLGGVAIVVLITVVCIAVVWLVRSMRR